MSNTGACIARRYTTNLQSFYFYIVLLKPFTGRSYHNSAILWVERANTLVSAEMEPARAYYCFTPEQNDTCDGLLNLSDPFLDLNQALGFSLASPSKAPDIDDRTTTFDIAHTAMGLSTQIHPKPKTHNALDTTPISRLAFDLDRPDNELFGTDHEDRTMARAYKVQYRYEPFMYSAHPLRNQVMVV